jgi:glycosyltransferase involved in cell wall biosynthesis
VTVPKISIVTPSFNQGKFLESTIQSVVGQQYPNLEYVLIDGGSTDESPAIIDKYRQDCHFACSEPDGGHIAAINKGFSHTTGEIMAWLNSDDMYFPWTLRTVASIMTAFPEIEWLSTLRPAYWDYHGYCIDVGHAIPGFSKEAFLDGCYIQTTNPDGQGDMLSLYPTLQQESTFWRRSLWERAGGQMRTEFKLAADFDLWGRFYEHGMLYGTRAPLAGFRFQFAQKSAQRDAYFADARKSLELLRQRVGWLPNKLRRRAIRFRLDEIPHFRGYVTRRIQYRGLSVVRREPSRPEAYWKVLESTFFRNL